MAPLRSSGCAKSQVIYTPHHMLFAFNIVEFFLSLSLCVCPNSPLPRDPLCLFLPTKTHLVNHMSLTRRMLLKAFMIVSVSRFIPCEMHKINKDMCTKLVISCMKVRQTHFVGGADAKTQSKSNIALG